MFAFQSKNPDEPARVEAMRVEGSMFGAFLMRLWLESLGYKALVAEDQASVIIDGFFSVGPGDWVVYDDQMSIVSRMTDDTFVITYKRVVS